MEKIKGLKKAIEDYNNKEYVFYNMLLDTKKKEIWTVCYRYDSSDTKYYGEGIISLLNRHENEGTFIKDDNIEDLERLAEVFINLYEKTEEIKEDNKEIRELKYRIKTHRP